MIRNKNIIILAIFSFIFLNSCNSEFETENKKESNKGLNNEQFNQGVVKYKFELDIPTKQDDRLFVKIIHGAIESLIERIDPSFSLHFKDKRARLDLENVNLFGNEIKIDSLKGGIKQFDFEAKREISFESESNSKIARIEKIQDDKYKIVYTDKRKDILNHNCKQAFLIDKHNNDTTIIWYTPKITIPLSPFEYTSIDGLALELTLSGVHIFATSVAYQSQPDSLFIIPSDFEKSIDKTE